MKVLNILFVLCFAINAYAGDGDPDPMFSGSSTDAAEDTEEVLPVKKKADKKTAIKKKEKKKTRRKEAKDLDEVNANKEEPAAEKSEQPVRRFWKNRDESKFITLLNYSYLDLWMPSKIGLTLGYNFSGSNALEFEYLYSKLSFDAFVTDLGKISESRATLLFRSYSKRNTFSWVYGAYYNDFSIYLGSRFLSTVSASTIPSIDLIRVTTAGATWGIGNRWTFDSGMTFGVDWFVLNIPLVIIKSSAPYLSESSTTEEDRKTVRDVLDLFKRFPSFSAIKLQVGMTW